MLFNLQFARLENKKQKLSFFLWRLLLPVFCSFQFFHIIALYQVLTAVVVAVQSRVFLKMVAVVAVAADSAFLEHLYPAAFCCSTMRK